MFLSKRYPRAPLIGVGFSLGANVLTRYLAEEGSSSRLVAGCALGCVSPPIWSSFLSIRRSAASCVCVGDAIT